MGVHNYGSQTIVFKYKNPSTSKSFNNLLHNILPVGVYKGGTLTIVNNNTVRCSILSVFIADDVEKVAVKCETSKEFDIPITTVQNYIILRLDWISSENNFIDAINVSEGELRDTDIILGRGVYDGTTLISIDISVKTIPRSVIDSVDSLQIKENAVIDSKIGIRVLNQETEVPYSNSGLFSNFISWFGKRIKEILGTEHWFSEVPVSLTETKSHIDATDSIHGATFENTPNRIVSRDENGDFSAREITANKIKGIEGLGVKGIFSAEKAQLANTFIDSGVYTASQDGFLITTDIPSDANVMTFLEFTMITFTAGNPCIGIVQCYPYATEDAITNSKYTAIGSAPAYCKIFFTKNNFLCFWIPTTGNYQTLHPVLHTNGGGYKIVSTTAEALPELRSKEVTANVFLPWSSINQGSGSGLDADTVDGSHYNATDVLTKLKTVDGSGTGLDADLLDGQHGSYYASKINPAFSGSFYVNGYPVAQYTTSTNTYELAYPVGSYIAAFVNNVYAAIHRNFYTSIGLSDDTTYTFEIPGLGAVSFLYGGWCACGQTGATPAGRYFLFRRIA